jgi:pentafunctional AROM polypeptide
MNVRPIGPLVDALRSQGAVISYTGNSGCLPLCVTRAIDPQRDSLTGTSDQPSSATPSTSRRRVVKLSGKLSSQYVSSVLMAAPLFPAVGAAATAHQVTGGVDCEAPEDWVELILDEEHPTSLPYITMTLAVMADFGIRVVSCSRHSNPV